MEIQHIAHGFRTEMFPRMSDRRRIDNTGGFFAIDLSAAQIQTLEYIMENENTKMSDIARKLGVTRSTFSKNAKNLIDKGLLKKYRREDNKKDIYLFATDFGKEVYHQYTDFVYNNWYQELFKIADTVPQEYLDKFEQMLDWYTYTLIAAGKVEDKIPGFIPVEDEKSDLHRT